MDIRDGKVLKVVGELKTQEGSEVWNALEVKYR